jgi:hypothetical protein
MLQSTPQACNLDLTQLPATAREAHIIPGLTYSSLMSIGKLCDADCEATFTKHAVTITKNNKLLLTGLRDKQTGLWRVPLTNPIIQNSSPITNSRIECKHAYQTQKILELIQFLHTAAFSPVASTWITAIQCRFFQSWPGLANYRGRTKISPKIRSHNKRTSGSNTQKSPIHKNKGTNRTRTDTRTQQPANTSNLRHH